MTDYIIGWDVGGANVKAVRIDATRSGEPVVLERAYSLWREPQRLSEILAEVAARLGGARAMAVTMTAELADCFATKREGVGCVIDAFQAAFPGAELSIYGVDGVFRAARAAREQPLEIASANWMASATLVARTFPDALLLDAGSTTTDVIPIVGGSVVATGRTDPERLMSGELVYTGALRTPVCAIVRSVPVRGRRCRVAAEHFAVAADVHRWLGRIDEGEYACETPDGRGRSRPEAGARLARMMCADLEMLDADDITVMAGHVARAQVRRIAAAIRQVLRRLGPAGPNLAILAGSGAFIARSAAEAAGLTSRDLSDAFGSAAARVAPAAAVAYLLAASARPATSSTVS